MRTEMARVQIAAQEESYKANGYDQYVFLAIGTACPDCLAINGQHFYVADMQAGENAPPMHPNCRCSTAAWMDRAETMKQIKAMSQVKITSGTITVSASRQDVLKNVNLKTGKMSNDEYALAKSLWNSYNEIQINYKEKAFVTEELDNNLTAEEKSIAIVRRPIGNYYYTAINLGHANYKIIKKEIIQGIKENSMVDDIMDEIFGEEWRTWE